MTEDVRHTRCEERTEGGSDLNIKQPEGCRLKTRFPQLKGLDETFSPQCERVKPALSSSGLKSFS